MQRKSCGAVMTDDNTLPIVVALAEAFVIVIYMLPAIIAHGRRHRQRLAIFFLTLLAGWTLIGWLAAIV
jgi:hypothetical protein